MKHYVVCYQCPNFTNFQAFFSEGEKKVAQDFVMTLPEDHAAYTFSIVEELGRAASHGMLVKIYNAFSEKPIQKFENAKVGASRVFALVERLAKPFSEAKHEPAEVEPESTSEEETDMAASNGTAKKKAPKKAKAEGGAKRKRTSYEDGAKIEVLIEGNPRREGTKAHKMFALFRNGMLVKTYFENKGSAGALKKSIAKKWVKIV